MVLVLYVLGVLFYIIVNPMFVFNLIINLRINGTLKIVLLYGCLYLLDLINLKLQIVRTAAHRCTAISVNIAEQNIRKVKQ